MNILIFNGILNFQIVKSRLTLLFEIKARYIDLIEKIPFWCNPQINLSSMSVNLVLSTRATRLCQQLRLLPTMPLWKDIFRGTVLNTDMIEMCFFLVIVKSVRYNSFIVKFPNYLSSQNLTFYPLHNWNRPRLRKDSLTLIKPLQKYESPCFLCTRAMVLSLPYFLLKKFCHTPSSFISLNSHLLSKQ
jgi:hypothetical protein